MWRIKVEAEADDPGLLDQVLRAIDTWRQECDHVSVQLYEEGPKIGSRKIIRQSASSSFRAGIEVSAESDSDESAGG
jgi:hypothetical protein